MKKKLKGLFALYLALAVLMSSVQALAETVNVTLYTGSEELQLGQSISSSNMKWIRDGLELDTPLNTQEFAQNINTRPGYVFAGWRLWSYFSSEGRLVDGPIEKAADGTVSRTEYDAYESGPDDFLIEPKLVPKYRISEQPSAANGYTVTAQEDRGTDTPDWQDTDNASFQWYNAAVTPQTFYVVDEEGDVGENEIGAYIMSGSYTDGSWHSELYRQKMSYDGKHGIAFAMQSDSDEPLFLAGEKITITPSAEFQFNSELAEIIMYDMDNDYTDEFTEVDRAYTYTFEQDVMAVEGSFFSSADTAFTATIRAEKPTIVKTLLSGETSASLVNAEAGKTYICYVTFDPEGDNVTLSSDAVTAVHSHDMSVECGQTDAVSFEHALTSEDGKLYINGAVLEKGTGYSNLPLPDGNYYLADNVTISDGIEIQGDVNLCLNGHTLDIGAHYISVLGSGKLSLCDCKEGGAITGAFGASTTNSAAIMVSNEFSMYGGKVINTYSESYPYKSAVANSGTGTINLFGGELTSNNGHAVCVFGGALHLAGAPKITGAAGNSLSDSPSLRTGYQ